jgi:hypothetical protein
MEHLDQDGSLIDTRQPMYVALLAVTQAYVQGQLSVEDLRSIQVELDYNSNKLQEKFGYHPFFELANEIELRHAEWTTFPDKIDEVWFREQLRRFIGHGVCASNNAPLVMLT